MVSNIFTAIICATLLAWSSQSGADETRPRRFLGLDLSQALLSPEPLGPPAEFVQLPVQAAADRGGDGNGAQARAETKAAPRIIAHKPRIVIHTTRVAHPLAARPGVATKLAHRHGNPLDAQAFDARIQVWPCKSGGICGWKR